MSLRFSQSIGVAAARGTQKKRAPKKNAGPQERAGKPGQAGKSGPQERTGKPGQAGKRPGQAGKSGPQEKTGKRPSRPEQSGRPGSPDRPGRSDRSDRPVRSDRPDRSDRPSRPEQSDRSDRLDRSGRSDRSDRPDRQDRPDRSDRPSRPSRSAFSSEALESFAEARATAISPWARAEALLPPLSGEARDILTRLPEALRKVRPLSSAHRRTLPEDIAALSRLLTVERRDLHRPYWSSPALTSAYMYYFLPWNLLRLARLASGLFLPDPVSPEGGEALLMDIGSGPLTFPLALWLARPAWRTLPIRVLALDSAIQPLDLGRALCTAVGELTGQAFWPVHTVRGPLESLPRHAATLMDSKPSHSGATRRNLRPWLMTAANVLNELQPDRRAIKSGGYDEYADEDDDENGTGGGRRDQRLEGLLTSLGQLWNKRRPADCDAASAEHSRTDSAEHTSAAPASHSGAASTKNSRADLAALFVEPGTRLGGITITRLRDLAIDGGLAPLLPCPHTGPCPLARGRSWCHFTFDHYGAPQWLRALSDAAGLAKSGLSLAPLLLAPDVGDKAEQKPAAGKDAELVRVRIVSAPFSVPGVRGKARYACTAWGLALVEDAEALPSGSLLSMRIPAGARRDGKSGAVVIPRP